MRILHCSDVHVIGDYGLPLLRLGWRRLPALYKLRFGGRGRDYRDARRVLAQIAGDVRRLGAGHLVVSGDLTAYGKEDEFPAAREALGDAASDPARCTVVPGNHDTYTPRAVRDRRFERSFGHLLGSDLPEHRREGAYPFVRLLEGAAIVGLLSARVPALPGMSFGWIGRPQLEGLRAIVEDPRLEGRAVVIAVHHAPLSRTGGTDAFHHRLYDARALFEIARGPRFAVLHGHIHRRFHHPATATRPHLFGAGSSTMLGREGYWLIEVEGGRIAGAEMRTPGA